MMSDSRKTEVNLKGEALDIARATGIKGDSLLYEKDSFNFKYSETESNAMSYFGKDYMDLSDEYKKFLEEDKKGREAEKALEEMQNSQKQDETKSLYNWMKPEETIFDQLLSNAEELKKRLLELLKELFGYEDDGKDYLSDLKGLNFENPQVTPLVDSGGQARGMRISYERKEFKYSKETVKFQASGYVQTEDGKFISLDLNFHSKNVEMSLSRDRIDIDLNKYQADPLIINLDGKHHGLSNITIDFDLDVDGVMDRISFAREGAGFLALDKNGDGKINDGTELFGPQSGNGFKDLAVHDEDGNGWIDENDSVFKDLKIWTLADGEQTLISLKEAGVGAIHLGYATTNMQVMNDRQDARGTLRSTGIFLKETGEVGSVQHIDLTL
ncbi:MAG: hypothetical protein GX219_09480 [Tissierellia bacterium]|nr:hypothetical protein [Tissierellia bacterium]